MLSKKAIPLERQLRNVKGRERRLKARLVAMHQKLDQAAFDREGALSLLRMAEARLTQLEQAALASPLHTWVPRDPRAPGGHLRQTDVRGLAAVQACLDLGPDCSIAAVARHMGRSRATAWEWIHRAIDAGWLTSERFRKEACLNITPAARQRIPALRIPTNKKES